MQQHIKRVDVVLCTNVVKISCLVATVAVKEQQPTCAYYSTVYILNKVPQLEFSIVVSSLAIVAYTKRLVRQKVLLILSRDVVLSYNNQVKQNSLTSSVNSLDNYSLLIITQLYRFRLTTPLYTSNNYVQVLPAYYKASFIKVVGVLVQNSIRSLRTLYKLELAFNYLRILALYSLLVVQLIKTRSKALYTLYKVVQLALANQLNTTLSKQPISYNLYSVERGQKSL